MTEHPELADWDDSDADRPLRSARTRTVLRVVVLVGILLLVLPGVLIAVGAASATAARACAVYTAYLRPDAATGDARFELAGPGGIGWQCYSVSSSGPETFLMSLGLIPSAPRVPRGVQT